MRKLKLFLHFYLLTFAFYLPLSADPSSIPNHTPSPYDSPNHSLPSVTPSPDLPTMESPSYEPAFMKMIIALVGLIVLFVLSIWMLRKIGRFRFGGKHNAHAIQILERCALSPKTVLFLVEVDNKKVLLAESQLEVRRLATLENVTIENPEN